MLQSPRLVMQLTILLCLLGATLAEQQLPMTPGSCSVRCQKDAPQTNATLPCSCSSSCSTYRDCCFDSPHREEEWSASSKMCLSLSTRGQILAVSGCPSSWEGPSSFCTDNIGHLPPVTSTDSGTTYANLYCAVCNEDGERLTTWDVRLKCCPEHEDSDGRRYVYRQGYLWSKVGNDSKCVCHYTSRSNDTSFADSLELRSCDRSQEIAKCSSSWRDEGVKELCRTFLDRVYIGEKIYRNIYCGQCNFERLDQVQCIPTIVKSKLSKGWNMVRIYEYCTSRQLTTCLHYLDHWERGRGKSFTFSSLLNIREEGCAPPPRRRCCEGERWDFKAKMCRQLVPNNNRRAQM